MTGFRSLNNSNNIISVDTDSWSYVYLGKVQIDSSDRREQDYYITCVGYPLVFIQVPYNSRGSGDNDAAVGHGNLILRSGVQIVRVRPGPNPNSWFISVRANFTNYPSAVSLPVIFLRVFGKLHDNFPNGSGQPAGLRLRNTANQLIFDTGCRQLRLAGNTYNAELALQSAVPLDSDRVDRYDTAVAFPFSMENKSVMANTRGDVVYPYYTGHYEQFDPPASIDQYDIESVTSLFWASGNTLYAKKASVNTDRLDTEANIIIVTNGSVTYTRVAVIDNNLFP